MAAMTEITCACGCGRKRMVRTADVKRGWGKYYSKSCKALDQARKTGRKRRGRRMVEHVEVRRTTGMRMLLERKLATGSPDSPAYSDDDLDVRDAFEKYGYGHPFASGDEGHGQD